MVAEGPLRDFFLGEHDRVLRVSRHPTEDRVVVSIWSEGVCMATFQLRGSDAARLASVLIPAALDHHTWVGSIAYDEDATPT